MPQINFMTKTKWNLFIKIIKVMCEDYDIQSRCSNNHYWCSSNKITIFCYHLPIFELNFPNFQIKQKWFLITFYCTHYSTCVSSFIYVELCTNNFARPDHYTIKNWSSGIPLSGELTGQSMSPWSTFREFIYHIERW